MIGMAMMERIIMSVIIGQSFFDACGSDMRCIDPTNTQKL